jgi:hypothetical protein
MFNLKLKSSHSRLLMPFFFLCDNVYFQGLVLAGLADMARPAEKLSPAQSSVLMATGKLNYCLLYPI